MPTRGQCEHGFSQPPVMPSECMSGVDSGPEAGPEVERGALRVGTLALALAPRRRGSAPKSMNAAATTLMEKVGLLCISRNVYLEGSSCCFKCSNHFTLNYCITKYIQQYTFLKI
jgi:hypothetical protein